jgi:type II secretory pathway component PulF
MLFSSRLPLQSLIELCRVLRHSLSAGIMIRDVFRQLADRGPRPVRAIAGRIALDLERGESLEAALAKEQAAFPPLFLSLAKVGEETGNLPEVLGELEKYYLLQQRLGRTFRAKSMLPLIELVFAFFIIALLIAILGWISASRGTQAPAIFGFSGGSGAILFLLTSFGIVAAIFAVYLFVTRALHHKEAFDAMVLRIPGVGPCLEALVLGRFALALQLTMDTGMSLTRALRMSLAATGNASFAARADGIAKSIKKGDDLTVALAQSGLFKEDFLGMVAVGEEGGRVPEIMRHQAQYYHEEAERRLTILIGMLSWGVWLAYAIFMVVAIFGIARMYFSPLGA